MATLKFEAIAKAGQSKDGAAKWHKCGVVFESEKGLSVKIDSLPVGFDGWLSLKEPKAKDDRPASKGAPRATGPMPDDPIPF